jgi:hypothetical protein
MANSALLYQLIADPRKFVRDSELGSAAFAGFIAKY